MHSFGADNYLTRVFDTLPQGMLIVDPQWIVLKLNPAAERMFGVVQDQVKGRVLWEVAERFPPDFIERARGGQKLESPLEYESNGSRIELNSTFLDDGSQVIQVREDRQKALHRRSRQESSGGGIR